MAEDPPAGPGAPAPGSVGGALRPPAQHPRSLTPAGAHRDPACRCTGARGGWEPHQFLTALVFLQQKGSLLGMKTPA